MLIAWLLVTFGVTIVITKSRIGAPLRRRFPIRTTDGSGPDDKRVTLAHLLRCPMCTGWWVGLALSPLHIRVLQDAFWAPSSPGMFIAQEASWRSSTGLRRPPGAGRSGSSWPRWEPNGGPECAGFLFCCLSIPDGKGEIPAHDVGATDKRDAMDKALHMAQMQSSEAVIGKTERVVYPRGVCGGETWVPCARSGGRKGRLAVATFNKVEKVAINQAHREVGRARDDLRKLLAEEESRTRSPEEVVAWLPQVLKMLERAEGNIDVVLGRPRT